MPNRPAHILINAPEENLIQPNRLRHIRQQYQDVDLIYFDSVEPAWFRSKPYLKPEFSAELLLSHDYFGSFLLSRRLWKKLGGFNEALGLAKSYDLALRANELTESIVRIPEIMFSRKHLQYSDEKDYISQAMGALRDALKRRNLSGNVIYRQRYHHFRFHLKPQQQKKIAIIIPFRDQAEILKRCLYSIEQKTEYAHFECILLDHFSQEESTHRLLQALMKQTTVPITIAHYEQEFNFSAMNNFALQYTDADFFLFLNNDTEVKSIGWLEQLLAWAEQPHIGAVGAKLLFPNSRVQHAGVVLGVGGIANHAYYRQSAETSFYHRHLHCVRNYSAVTGACLMVEKKKLEQVGGWNEQLSRSYNDVDLCLRLKRAGYRSVYNPEVELVHYESLTRDPQVSHDEEAYMQQHWQQEIENDPMYHPELSKHFHPRWRPIFSRQSLGTFKR